MAAPRICLIAAVGKNGVIGTGDDLPWKIKSEMRYFMRMTKGKPYILGRKTFETHGPLKNRDMIVVTRNPSYARPGVTVVSSLEDALTAARATAAKTGAEEIMVGGGAEIYRLALPLADRLYITEVNLEPEGRTTFPAFDRAQWVETLREHHPAQDGDEADFTVTVLERK